MSNPGAGLGLLIVVIGVFCALLKFAVDIYRIVVQKIKHRKPKITAVQQYEMELEEKRRQDKGEQPIIDDVRINESITAEGSIPTANTPNWNKAAFRLWIILSVPWVLYFGWNSLDVFTCDSCTYWYHDAMDALTLIPTLPVGLLLVWYSGRWVLRGAKSQ